MLSIYKLRRFFFGRNLVCRAGVLLTLLAGVAFSPPAFASITVAAPVNGTKVGSPVWVRTQHRLQWSSAHIIRVFSGQQLDTREGRHQV
jgi:hypothetical protein